MGSWKPSITGPVVAVAAALAAACTGAIEREPSEEAGRPADGERPKAGEVTPPARNDKSPGGRPADGIACASSPVPRRVWKLTPSQYSNTVRTLVPSLSDAGRDLRKTLPHADGAFLNEPSRNDMSQPHFDQLFEAAQTVAAEAVRDPAALAPCLAAAARDPACVRGFVESFGSRAFRRPLEAEEIARFTAFFEKEETAEGRAAAIGGVVRAFLLSPSFLYRTELGAPGGTGPVALTPYERASALSYLLLDGPPDAPLMEAARRNELRTAAQVEGQTRRLLAAPGAARGVLEFFRAYLSTDGVLGRTKNLKAFPGWNDALIAAIAREPLGFLERALWTDGGRFSTLFTAEYSVGGKELVALYGATAAEAGKMQLPRAQRAGVLTQASLMASLATEDDTDVIGRGKFVRERLLCQALPPPPPTVSTVPPKPDGVQTHRERLDRHTKDPTCAVCHRMMDPIGFLFERYDAVGRYRTTEVGKTIDTSGMIADLPQGDVALADALALGKLLGGLPEAQRCFVQKVDMYVNGEADDARAACRVEHLIARFRDNGGDVLDTFLAAVTAEHFLLRSN